MKKALKMALVVCLTASLSFIVGTSVYAAKKTKIGITAIVSAPPLDEAKRGFFDGLEKLGYHRGNTTFYHSVAEGDMSLCASIAQSFVQRDVDLIVAVTTPSAQAAVAAAKGTDIPVIFMAVTAPAKAGLVQSWENPGGNVTGVSDRMDVPAQAALIKEFLPNAKRIGTIFNSGEVNSLVQIKELKAASKGLGFEIIEASVSATPELIPAAESLVGRVDAIFLPTDNIISAGLEAVSKVCEDNDIPLFGADVNQVPRGEIAALGIRYYEHGQAAAVMAAAILKGEKKASEIPVSGSEMDLLWVYPAAAKRMGVTIPQHIMDKANKIVED
jgi:putative tryptophan/tyrosine transport system substrate-binding protein